MEWQKLFAGRKYLAVILLMLLQIILFTYTFCQRTTEEAPAEYDGYAEQYAQHIAQILENADNMNGIGIFSGQDTFSEHNIAQTIHDFSRLLSVQPVAFDGEFLTVFFEYKTTNFFLVISAILLAGLLSDKKGRGIQRLIRSSARGREKIVCRRIGTLFISDLLCVVLFYGSLLCLSALLYQSNLMKCLGYPIQSLPLFQDLTWRVSIGVFLLIYILFRCLIVFLISLITWTILYVIDYPILSGAILAAFAVAEYILYAFIPANHTFSILHYCNLFYLSPNAAFFKEYKNLNIFSQAVSKDAVIAIFYIALCILMLAVSICFGRYRYPVSRRTGRLYRLFSRIIRLWNRGMSFIQERLSVGGIEYYKLLFMQKGIIILIIVLGIWFYQDDHSNIQYSGTQKYYSDFMEEHTGKPTDASARDIAAVKEELALISTSYETVAAGYQKGEFTEEELFEASTIYEAFKSKRDFLRIIQDQTDYLTKLKADRGIEGWYISSYCYNYLFEYEKYINTLLLLLSVVMLSSNAFATESRYNMRSTIRSSSVGRNKVYTKKLLSAAVVSALLYSVICGMQISATYRAYGIHGLMAPAQSYFMLKDFPVPCNMLTYLIGYFMLRCFLIVLLAIVSCECANLTEQRPALIIMSLFAIAVERIFHRFAVPGADIRFIAALVLIAGALSGLFVFRGHRNWRGKKYEAGN